MKMRWDWRAACLTRPGTQPPDPEGVVALLVALEEKCGRDGFRLVFPGPEDRKRCFLAYREPGGNGDFLATLGTLAEAANLKLERATADWPEPKHVLQLAEPRLEAEVPKTIKELTGLGPVALHSQGGQMLKLFVGNGDGTVPQAAAFRTQKGLAGSRAFWPGPFGPRKMLDGGVTLTDLAAGFYLDHFEPELSPVSVQVGTAEETGSPVFVDAGAGHVLILCQDKSTVGPIIGNQLALKATQAGQIVVVVQPQVVEDLGVLAQANPKVISTRMDERTITAWQSQVLVGQGLTVVQGHPGGDALERLQTVLEGLWTAAQMESCRAGWPGMLVVINDFIPTVSEPKPDESDRRLLSPYRHRLYEVLAQTAGSFNAIRLVLLGRPSVVFGVDHLRAVVGSFGQTVRLRTVAEGFPPGEGYSHDRFEDQEIREWLHAPGAHDRCLVLGPEGWVKTKLELVEPEVEMVAEPVVQILRSEEVNHPNRWEPRQRRAPTAQPPPASAAPIASVSADNLERLLKARGVLPLRPYEREALEELRKPPAVVEAVVEPELVAAKPERAAPPASPKPKPPAGPAKAAVKPPQVPVQEPKPAPAPAETIQRRPFSRKAWRLLQKWGLGSAATRFSEEQPGREEEINLLCQAGKKGEVERLLAAYRE